MDYAEHGREFHRFMREKVNEIKNSDFSKEEKGRLYSFANGVIKIYKEARVHALKNDIAMINLENTQKNMTGVKFEFAQRKLDNELMIIERELERTAHLARVMLSDLEKFPENP